MKKLKIFAMALVAFVTIALPLLLVVGAAVIIPPQYDKTFVGALDDKMERLNSIEEDKIIVVGGSSVAFGLDSQLMEEQTGMPVVNFGLYAALGTKVMLDLSRAGVKEGDVVIIAPEMDAQTLSMYFSSETTLQAADGDLSILSQVRGENILSLIGGSWKYLVNKFSYFINGNAPDPEGVYNSDSFDEYGDIIYERPNNVMNLYYDPNKVIELEPGIFEEEFIDYINDYVSYCKSRGADVFFSFCPMNELGMSEKNTDESIDAFVEFLDENLRCDVISDPRDYIMEAGYFFDSNFHLNDAGVIRRSVKLTEDIFFALGIPDSVTVEIPEAPELPESDTRYFDTDENDKFFTYELIYGSEGNVLGARITGLTEEGKKQTTLTVPLGAEGYKVIFIGADAFAGGAATTVIIQDITISNTSHIGMDDGLFRGSKVKKLYIKTMNEETVVPPSSNDSTIPVGLEVYIPAGSSYRSGYFWGQIASRLVFIDDTAD